MSAAAAASARAPRPYRAAVLAACLVAGVGALLSIAGVIPRDATAWSSAPLLLLWGVQCCVWPGSFPAFGPHLVQAFGFALLALVAFLLVTFLFF